MPHAPAPRFLTALLAACSVALTLCPAHVSAQTAQAEWHGIERVLAFADVHGAHDELVLLLRESGVLDAQDRWAAGRAHVVSLGDLLDRGADSRKVMDLLMRLQSEARAAGGGLHVVLGNHEAMNVLGDLRYVDPGEYAAYVDLEPTGMREKRRVAWEAANGPGSGAAFDQKFPAGYFGHRAALAPEGRYGRWLLGLPVAIVIDDTLFLHGGPSQALRGMTVTDLNTRYRTALVDYLRLAGQLESAGLLQPGAAFNAKPRLAAQRLAARAVTDGAGSDATADAALAAAVKGFEQADAHPLINPDGPNWYRGAALCQEVAETDVLAPLLEQFKVARVVVGHTPTRDLRAVTRFDGRVVKLDAGMNRAVYKGRGAALLIDGDALAVRYTGEPQATALKPEGLYVAPNAVSDAVVLAALEAGTVSVTGPRGPDELDVVVEHQGRRIPAVFQQRGTTDARREVAAHRLDRYLGLGIVPATAAREVAGQRGVVQARPAKAVTQADVQRQSLRGGGWCALEPQFQLVYAFDALVGNEGRTLETLLFDADEWYVYVTNHARAFGSGRAFPAYLKAQPPKPGPELRRRLALLHEDTLAAVLGDLVDTRARKSILERRDALLALPAAGAAAAR
ncbi:MAG TPA: metallophosphoesterase [Steroidobacteraceae bacterium]|nr:metallophosphoesterase [Steroidobacteraceae bacterium]